MALKILKKRREYIETKAGIDHQASLLDSTTNDNYLGYLEHKYYIGVKKYNYRFKNRFEKKKRGI